ncbi:putative bifunctional diguanylate cyclase/phosphodiesterase [Methylotenera mobilis]|uniref:Diguanylate cyclase/phosphodiesterase n=1 Tax=Methylotenera mobilis (strain JLW8 / ATCC BAA-1282 / DSM 17540) TaxID=583345 RepID=C6WYR6_METML|nr:bifunctional diguanylate cyclase/phosphodiesterase [Methylotenera mobilis]ACT47041.1 diguanylate cyclase/phosphodiesterase [Methylotenera mobilis JLW8]
MLPNHLENMRLQVTDRLAALLESQTRSKIFSSGVVELIRSSHQEVVSELKSAVVNTDDPVVAQVLGGAVQMCDRLDQSLEILFQERNRQWHRNGNYVQSLVGEFNETLTGLASTLIEKDLLERQSRVLERIILSHEHVAQWKEFVQEILADFHAIFPFNFFYIAFAEEHDLSLYLYYLGNHSEEAKRNAREMLSKQMIANLALPDNAPLSIEEFVVRGHGITDNVDAVRMITVAVPDHTPKLAGLLGVAYVSSGELSPQEESVVRSILSVMVMVVGSSKLLSRTLSELEYYAMHDPLTGIYNRRQFNNMLEYEIGRSERHHHEFSLLQLDLDDFKDINDSYGHQTGDEALCGVAEVLREHIRKGDLAARIGGDEFAVILMETGREGATTVANMLGKSLRERTFTAPDGKHFHLTVSIGIATYPIDAQNEADLQVGADAAMYRAKDIGKDSACTLDELDGKVEIGRHTRDNAEKLREALQQDRIIPYYHNIVDCKTGELFACETLARLVEPDGNIVSASMFIETIEKYGMGRDLDRMIINKAFRAKRELMLTGESGTKMFLNISAQEIQGRGILAYAEELCQTLEIPPSCVVFEILERDAIGDMTNMRKFLSNLREKGFAFALDDFGSGYNSFHYLRELRFEYVKIDGAFVRNILNSKIDYALVHNLSRLCQDIGIYTVAEFVETQEILEALKDMGINYVQGFHIGLPSANMHTRK